MKLSINNLSYILVNFWKSLKCFFTNFQIQPVMSLFLHFKILQLKSKWNYFSKFLHCLLSFLKYVFNLCVLRSEFPVVVFVTISAQKRCSVHLYLQLFVEGLMFYLPYLCLLCIVVSNTYCVVFLRFVYPILTVSLGYPFLIATLYSLTFIYIHLHWF